MTSRQRKHVARLERRARRLEQRLGENYQGDPDRQRAELVALNYAITIIASADRMGMLATLEHFAAVGDR